jgi:hypothetical protein
MDPEQDAARQRRQNFLSVFLTVLAAAFFLFVLILISGGFFFYVLQVALGVTGLIALNYLLWGRALSMQVAGEREEEQLRERAAAAEWPEEEEPRPFRR